MLCFVPKIKANDQRFAFVNKLQSQVQIAFKVRGIDDINDDIAVLNELERGFIGLGKSFQGIESRRIEQLIVVVTKFKPADFYAHGRADVIRRNHGYAGNTRENKAFTDIGISYKGDFFHWSGFVLLDHDSLGHSIADGDLGRTLS